MFALTFLTQSFSKYYIPVATILTRSVSCPVQSKYLTPWRFDTLGWGTVLQKIKGCDVPHPNKTFLLQIKQLQKHQVSFTELLQIPLHSACLPSLDKFKFVNVPP